MRIANPHILAVEPFYTVDFKSTGTGAEGNGVCIVEFAPSNNSMTGHSIMRIVNPHILAVEPFYTVDFKSTETRR